MSKSLTVKEKTNEVALSENESFLTSIAGEMENDVHFSQEQMVMPRIAITAGTSPQLQRSSEKYIQGCGIGDIVDTSTNEILAKYLDETFPFLPVTWTREAIQWSDESTLMERYPLDIDEKFIDFVKENFGVDPNEDFKFIASDKSQFVEHWNYYGIDLDRMTPCFIGVKRSGLKPARRWNTAMNNAKLPNGGRSPKLYFHFYDIGTFTDNGSQGEYPNWRFGKGHLISELPNTQAVFEMAKDLEEIIKAGKVKADVEAEKASEDAPF